MWIRRIRLRNYSSFDDSDWIDLSRGLNVVIGQNNSGKSALLAAVSSILPDKPHRNLERFLPADLGRPSVEIEAQTTTGEIRRRLSASGIAMDISVGRAFREPAVLRDRLAQHHARLVADYRCRSGEHFDTTVVVDQAADR